MQQLDDEDAIRKTSRNLMLVAKKASDSVVDLLMDGYRKPMAKGFKEDRHDIVTKYDRLAEDKIAATLLASVPESTVVGEEHGRRGSGEIEWHVDPIDGTSNFSRGLPSWCVSIAAVVAGRVVASVIHHPVSETVYSADLDGAWLNHQPLKSHASPDEIDATIVSSFPNAKDLRLFGNEAMDLQKELLLKFQAVRNLGSGALNLAYVASGCADATMGFRTHSWDIAAGVLLVEKSGGKFLGYDRGRRVEENHLANDYIAVGAGASYPVLSDLVRDYSSRYH